MNLSRTAARRTALTLLNRVWMVPGARPRQCISLTHCSMCERRTMRSGKSTNGTDYAAKSMARRVFGAQICRCDQAA